MTYPISEQLIKFNRSKKSLAPSGFVIHSTATPNATAQNEHDYFNGGDRQASAHYFADNKTIIRCIPENEQSWHAGQTANSKYLSVEMCEIEPFAEVWARTVWLVADACKRHGWTTGPNVWSHRGISAKWHETNHTDPIAYLVKNGKTWEQLLCAIDNEIANIRKPKEVIAMTTTTQAIKGPIAPDDVYLSVRVREQYADELIKTIRGLGYATDRLLLP